MKSSVTTRGSQAGRAILFAVLRKGFAFMNYFIHYSNLLEQNRSKTMKMTKMFVVTLLAGFVLQQPALCQTNNADASPTAPGGASPSITIAAGGGPASGVVVSNTPAVAVDTNAPAGLTASNVTAEAGSAGSTNASSGGVAAPAAAAELPVISFNDVPITLAIESLARLAGINYLLDPKIGYGQPDATGLIKPEPTLSIRWDHVTATRARGAAGQLRPATRRKSQDQNFQNHAQGSHCGGADDHPDHPVEIRQHLQHGDRRQQRVG